MYDAQHVMQKKHTGLYRGLVLLLCLVMLVASFQFDGISMIAGAADDSISQLPVQFNGKEIDSIVLPQDEKRILTVAEMENAEYKWQISTDESAEQWINISGQHKNFLTLSYAMVGSLLSDRGITYVRCIATNAGDVLTSSPIKVTVSYTVPEVYGTSEQTSAVLKSAVKRANALANDADSDFQSHTITINYIYENGNLAFEPYVATIEHGGAFTATVTFPTVVGYLPYFGEASESTSGYTIDISSVTEDVTYTVTYKPALVNYTVRHLTQNILDDNYELHDTTTKQGLTGAEVSGCEIDIDGFSPLFYEKLKIAADGSTEIEIYYDRNYYLVSFDLQGGYGVEPVYTRYGATVSVNKPTRSGYMFDGWELIECGGQAATAEQKAEYDLDKGAVTLPSMNLKYQAKWITAITSYTIVYWRENADDDGYSYWGSQIVGANANGVLDGTVMSGDVVNGSDNIPSSITTTTINGNQVDEKKYFTYNNARTDKNVIVEGDGSTVVNVYYTRNVYTIYFTGISGKCVIEEHTHGTNCNSQLLCTLTEHTHDENCERILNCNLVEHTAHTDSCLICGLTEHAVHTSDCLICGQEEHTAHTTACYDGVGNQQNVYTGLPSSSTDGLIIDHWYYGNLIYIQGSWYQYSGSTSSGSVAPTTCSGLHTHTDACYKDTIHIHSDSCYKDSLHTHTDSCYIYSCGLIEHTHTDSCYSACTKLEHTHDNSCNQNRTDNVIYVVAAKYDQTIGNVWPTAADFPDITFQGWTIDGINGIAVSKRINMTSDLCDTSDNLKYAQAVTGGSKTYLYYMFESFDQTSDANGNDRILRDGVYYDKSELYYQEVYSSGNWNQKEIMGMSPVANGVETNGSNVFLYYKRNRYNLNFQNVSTIVKTISDIMYQYPIKDIKDSNGNLVSAFIPEYPSTLEPNAYEFVGWYTTPECFDGTEFNFATATMPNGDLTLYAKWAPKSHIVRVFKTSDMTEQIDEQIVLHGNFATAPGEISNGNYVFNGWFYMDNGEKKAFDFNNMPVNRDLDIFAEWSSKTPVLYTIRYQLKDGTVIADPTIGSTLAGMSKTFIAKGGSELYEGYQEGYFPETNSHTILMNINGGNEFIFTYVAKENVPYTVRYLEKGTETVLHEDKYVAENKKSVVTEVFQQISGYMPDAYQKRLVLSANDEENVLIFWYTKDNEHAYYVITHWVQNLEGDGYTEYRSIQGPETIGKTITEEPLTLTGFIYNAEKSTPSGKLTEQGLKLDLYYDRNEYPYTVRYLEYGTATVLHDPFISEANNRFGKTVSATAVDIPGYSLVGEKTKTRTIRDSGNEIIFYYIEQEVTISYKSVPAGTGTVSIGSETVKAKTGTASGSTPAPADGYRFEGWFTDESCTTPVKAEWVDANNKLVPQKIDGLYQQVTYYAKFTENTASLTIEKTGAQDIDENQTFLFRVKGTDENTKDIDITVTVHGNGKTTIADLPVGNYTVTEKTDWSWRYTPEEASKNVALKAGGGTVIFANTRTETQWLDGDHYTVNLFGENQ